MYIIPVTWRSTTKRTEVQANPGIECISISKITNAKRAGGMPQVVECLPSQSQYEALSLIPQCHQKKFIGIKGLYERGRDTGTERKREEGR
jgi:hypothetical protein